MTLQDFIKQKRLITLKLFLTAFITTFTLSSVIIYFLLDTLNNINVILIKIVLVSAVISLLATILFYIKLKTLSHTDILLEKICTDSNICTIKNILLLILHLNVINKDSLKKFEDSNICSNYHKGEDNVTE